jgi:hypothetical protein
MPVSSMLALRKVDFTTNPARLRAAIKAPAGLRPQDPRLTFVVQLNDGTRHERSFLLAQAEESAASAGVDVKPPERLHIYRFGVSDLARIAALRDEIPQLKERGKGGRVVITVASKACREADLPSGPLLVTTYVKTAETPDYVVLLRDLDLRKLTNEQAIDQVPPCAAAKPA